MSRVISTAVQNNFWGRQQGTDDSPEPQRTDLFYVDFSQTCTSIYNYLLSTNVWVSALNVAPQLVRSFSFPEIKIKSDPVPRESIPFQMPSTDEPLDAIRVNFLLDTWNDDNRSDVLDFLEIWLALSRAGRGARDKGFNTNNNSGYFLLDSNFRVSFTYDFQLRLLRGNADQPVNQVNDSNSLSSAVAFNSNPDSAGLPASPTSTGNMVEHMVYTVYQAWLSGYRLSDFNYNESVLTLVEAVFYAADIKRASSPLTSSGGVQIAPANVLGDVPVSTGLA